MDAEERDLGVRGGQGRSVADLVDLGWVWLCFLGIFGLGLMVLVTSCSPSSRPRATAHEEGDDDAEDTRKPDWEKLRQQIGGL